MEYKLKTCVWEITLGCCFSCRYCGSGGGKARENELSTEECLRVAEQLADLDCGYVSLIGGEIFTRPDWYVILKKLDELRVKTAVITNGFLFTEETLRKLKEVHLSSVAVSVDGPEAVHDKYRQKGSFKRAEKAVAALRDTGILVSVISTLNAENVLQLEDLYEILKKWGVSAWQLQGCIPMGNAARSAVSYEFDHRSVIEFVAAHLYDSPFPIGLGHNIGYYTQLEGSLRGTARRRAYFTGCEAGLSSLGIDSTGNVRGCESLYDPSFNEGNVRERTLREIWEDPDAFAYNRKFRKEMLTGKCASCPHGEVCRGGCRSYNHFVHGKMYEARYCALGKAISDLPGYQVPEDESPEKKRPENEIPEVAMADDYAPPEFM